MIYTSPFVGRDKTLGRTLANYIAQWRIQKKPQLREKGIERNVATQNSIDPSSPALAPRVNSRGAFTFDFRTFVVKYTHNHLLLGLRRSQKT